MKRPNRKWIVPTLALIAGLAILLVVFGRVVLVAFAPD